MTELDGLAATRQIRDQLPGQRQSCIAAMTASALVEDRIACAAAGMDDYLAKPVRAEELVALLAHLVPTVPVA
jgi:CheY-like chemotaxis protein